MRYIEIKFEPLSAELMEVLIAMVPEYGFLGMEEGEDSLKAYAREGEADIDSLTIFTKSLGLSFSTQGIDEQNWNAIWESNFEPVLIPGQVHIRATFHPPLEDIPFEILITPKMSFGTGHHATTKMMIKAMLEMDFHAKQVIDFGTGTGILAILAEKLGAAKIDAIDNDIWSINNAIENAEMNACERININLGSSLETLNPCDILLANINRHVLEREFTSIASKVKKSGFLVLSGLLQADYEDILKVYGRYFGQPLVVLNENGWIALLFESQAGG